MDMEQPDGEMEGKKTMTPAEIQNINRVITEIKKKERIHKQQNTESLEVLVQTSLLHQQNAELAEMVAEKEKKLNELVNQIASKTHEAKMQKVAQTFVDEARQRAWAMEEAHFHERCKFHEDHWHTLNEEIKATYAEIEAMKNKKSDAYKRNIFDIQKYDWDAIIEETAAAEIQTPESDPSDDFDSQEMDNLLQKCEKGYLQESASKPNYSSEGNEMYEWDLEEMPERSSYYNASRSFGNSANISDAHTSWRQGTTFANQPTLRGPPFPRGSIQAQQGVTPMERSRQMPPLPSASQVRGYAQRPVTSGWVTSQFGANAAKSSIGKNAVTQKPTQQMNNYVAVEHDDFEWDCDFDENWKFDDEPPSLPAPQPNRAVEKKKATTFRPKQPTIK